MNAQPFVRRNVWTLPAGDETLQWYAKAVQMMQSRDPENDPTSWGYQAAIHGTLVADPLPSWNNCKHGTWYFVAWHRMYVYWFEQIVRAAIVEAGGPDDWALPYWNYGLNGLQASLPAAFRSPTSGNPLFVSERRATMNAGAQMPSQITTAAVALGCPQFVGTTQFGGGVTPAADQFYNQPGQLEQQPHNVVHDFVGGGGWMSDPDEAAQDPIFWLHHTNIDRLWNLWSAQAGHVDPSDARWTSQSFDFFDVNGDPVSMTCAEVVDTLALGYTYDDAPAPVAGIAPKAEAPMPEQPQEPQMVGATESPITLTGKPERLSVAIDSRARATAMAAAPTEQPSRIYLNIEDIEAEKNPGTVYGVYVGLPENAPQDVEALHHVGNLSFFGVERAMRPRGDEQPHALRFTLDITEKARALEARGQWDPEHVSVTLRPLEAVAAEPGHLEMTAPQARDEPPVKVGRISVFYA